MLLILGYRGDNHGLEPVVAHAPGIRFIAPDLPGFGASAPLTVEHTVDAYVHWLNGFVRALALPESTVILGHSFGSIITTRAIALGLPARALILVNPITTPADQATGAVLLGLTKGYYGLSRRLPPRLGDAVLRNWLIVQFMSQSLVVTDDRALRTWIHEEHHRYFNDFTNARMAAESFTASMSRIVTQDASDVRIPVLLIAGEQDRIAPFEAQPIAVSSFPDARLVAVPDVGHLIHYEKPTEAAAAIREFLDRLA